jgi:maleate cis-trans isomerase
MYSERGRIGLVVLDTDIIVEPEFRRLMPPGVEVFATRIAAPHELSKPEYLAALCTQARPAVRMLMPLKPSVVVFCCTSASFFRGKGWDEDVRAEMAQEAGTVPVTTTSTGVREALRHLGVRRLVVGTPYQPGINERLKIYLEAHGHEVLTLRRVYEGPGNSIEEDRKMMTIPRARMREFMLALDRPDADAMVLGCTGLAAVPLIAEVEAKIGKPVVSSNLGAAWHALTISGIGAIRKGFGRLASSLRQEDDLSGRQPAAARAA